MFWKTMMQTNRLESLSSENFSGKSFTTLQNEEDSDEWTTDSESGNYSDDDRELFDLREEINDVDLDDDRYVSSSDDDSFDSEIDIKLWGGRAAKLEWERRLKLADYKFRSQHGCGIDDVAIPEKLQTHEERMRILWNKRAKAVSSCVGIVLLLAAILGQWCFYLGIRPFQYNMFAIHNFTFNPAEMLPEAIPVTYDEITEISDREHIETKSDDGAVSFDAVVDTPQINDDPVLSQLGSDQSLGPPSKMEGTEHSDADTSSLQDGVEGNAIVVEVPVKVNDEHSMFVESNGEQDADENTAQLPKTHFETQDEDLVDVASNGEQQSSLPLSETETLSDIYNDVPDPSETIKRNAVRFSSEIVACRQNVENLVNHLLSQPPLNEDLTRELTEIALTQCMNVAALGTGTMEHIESLLMRGAVNTIQSNLQQALLEFSEALQYIQLDDNIDWLQIAFDHANHMKTRIEWLNHYMNQELPLLTTSCKAYFNLYKDSESLAERELADDAKKWLLALQDMDSDAFVKILVNFKEAPVQMLKSLRIATSSYNEKFYLSRL